MTRTFESVEAGLRFVGEAASLTDASRQLPEGAYTTLRAYPGGRVVRLDRHVERLNESAALQGRAGHLEPGAVRRCLAQALAESGTADARLRLTWATPRLFVSVEPFVPPAAALYRDGARCITVPLRRRVPHAKDTRFLSAASDAYARLPPGVHEGLLVADDGTLLEGLSSNFFAVRSHTLHTEADRVLAGVTRSMVLEVAQGVVPVSLAAVAVSDLPRIEEAFVTSASRGVLPVVEIDGVRIGDGRPGAVTLEIGRRFEGRVLVEAEPVQPA